MVSAHQRSWCKAAFGVSPVKATKKIVDLGITVDQSLLDRVFEACVLTMIHLVTFHWF